MRRSLLLISFAALAFSTAARADLSISAQPTQNMSCDAGVCTATAQKAVLNVGDLQTMLAAGDVTVKTGSLAKDIEIAQPLTWTATSRLTLDAQQSVIVKKQMTVSGQGALTVTTNDGGKHGEFIILPERGSIQFWDLGSSLIIDGHSYTLVGDIKTLAADIAANPSGFYALAKDYDASADGTYTAAPINTEFDGTFHGLGNKISNLTITVSGFVNRCGLFAIIGKPGIVTDTHLADIKFAGAAFDGIGGIADLNEGLVSRSSTVGDFSTREAAGGLVSDNLGSILNSFARVKIVNEDTGPSKLGGLAAYNGGIIRSSYSQGSIVARKSYLTMGGLVGENEGQIVTSYSTGMIVDGRQNSGEFGGLVGKNDSAGTISAVYAAGTFKIKSGGSLLGGLVGEDAAAAGAIASSYWDLDKGIGDPGQGAGNIDNDPGITGLTDAQLKSGLPTGFDPNIWASDPNLNNGYPYLLANPPQ